MKRIITAVLLVILILTMLCACRVSFGAKPFTNITSFRVVSYASGAWGEYNFDLTENGDAEITYFFHDSWGYEDDQDLIATVSADYLVELTNILNSHNLAAWNGYFKYDDIVDGHGFIIELTTDSGQEFYARGHEKYPKNYDAVSSAIYTFFDQFEYTEKPEEPEVNVYEDYDYVFTSTFSYEDTVQYYKENDWGVFRDGFVNIGEVPVEDPEHAIELAQNEANCRYDTIDVAYDIHARVYRVTFSIENALGGVVEVYISKDGNTLMMVRFD